jgi:Xaa-Pro aminopeptidase
MHSGMFGGPAPDPLAALIAMLGSMRDGHGNTTIDDLDNTQSWAGGGYPPDQFRADASVLDGVDLTGDGSVADLLWARPAVTVLGIDVPPVIGSTGAVQASAAARVSLRIPPGVSAEQGREALTAHLSRRVPWHLRCDIQQVALGDPFVGSLSGPGYETLKGALENAFGRPLVTVGQGGSIPLCNVLAQTFPGAEIFLMGVEGAAALSLTDWADGSDPYAATAELFDPDGTYAISDSAWAMHLLGLQAALPSSRYTSMTAALPMLRAVKDADELARLAAAGTAADAAFEQITSVRFAGRRESDIGADLDRLLREHGHSEVDFTVVGSGPNGANPHHLLSDREITAGDMVVLDFGGIMQGYGSDTTRTVHVGEPTDEERQVFEIVRQAQQAAFEAVRPGVACQDIDRAARTVIRDAGYGEYFIHRTGHGIGLTTHEPPYMVEGETRELVPGMCFSIEPGIYLPGRFGVRIEDIVTVTEDGGRRLNNTSHDLHIVS